MPTYNEKCGSSETLLFCCMGTHLLLEKKAEHSGSEGESPIKPP